jgi:hypothetical protein
VNRGPYASDRAAWAVAAKENRRRRSHNDPDRCEVVSEGDKFVIAEKVL